MHRHHHLLAAATLATALAAALAAEVRAADRHVPGQHASIAAALEAAVAGDRVIVAPGTYQEHGLDLPAGVTLLGDPDDPASVVIDAGGHGRVLRAESLEQPAAVIGMTLTGGHARGANAYETSGGGFLVSRAEIQLEAVVMRGNRADGSGGGLRVADGRVLLLACALRENVAEKGGGGIDLSYGAAADLTEVEIVDNEAAWGGGISVRADSQLHVDRGRLERNRALGSPGVGGALCCDLGADPLLRQCLLVDNEAERGGAIYAADGAAPRLISATIDRNVVSGTGAAFYLKDTDLRLERSIVSFHQQRAFYFSGDSAPSVSASDIYGNAGGDWVGPLLGQLGLAGNIAADPLYCATLDRHLREDSPCAPAQNDSGLVGALGVGCGDITDTPPVLAPLELRARPNPFNPRTEVIYSVPREGQVRLSVHDLRGRRLSVLVDGEEAAGEHRVAWEARDGHGRALSSGTYLLVLESGGQRLSSKIMLVR